MRPAAGHFGEVGGPGTAEQGHVDHPEPLPNEVAPPGVVHVEDRRLRPDLAWFDGVHARYGYLASRS